MSELLTTSLVWRLCAMLAGWLRRSPLGRGMRALGRLWRESATYRLFAWLLKRPCAVGSSAYCAASERRSARLSAWGQAHLLPVLRQSLFGGLCQAIGRAFRESLLLGRLCQGGFTAVLLAIVAAYAPLDWLLRDVLQLSLLGSIWDELLLLVGFVWAIYLRASAQKPLRSRVSGAGLGVGLYLLIGLVLLVWTWSAPVSVSISGFRASMQYLLLFYLVIDLLRDRADLLFMTKVIVLLGTLIALYGVAQYLLGVEIPSNWTDQAETAVRTRVFSIFSNPNILGGYLVLVTPITVGMAYTVEAPAEKVFYWLCALCMCLACLFTMTRGAWFALVVAAVCFALIVDRRLLLLMLVGGIAACFLPFVRSRIGYLFTDAFVESNNRGGRAARWDRAFGYVDNAERWAQGLGFGRYGGAVAMQNPINSAFEYAYVDNYYVKILAENGIVGLCGFITSMLLLLWNGARAAAAAVRARLRPLTAGMLCGLIGMLTASFFESLWEEPYLMAMFFSVAAMMIFAGRPEAELSAPN